MLKRLLKYNPNKMMNGNDIKKVQKLLNKNGANLSIDGWFGKLTLNAVKKFQEKNNLNPDGIVGPITMKALSSNKNNNNNNEDVKYNKNHIPKSHKKRPGLNLVPEYITIHSTGNPRSTAQNERAWLTNPRNTSVVGYHVVIDEKEAIEVMPLNEVAWHAGDGRQGVGNRKSIGVEIVESGDRDKVLENAIKVVANLLNKIDLDADRLRMHSDWSGKNCPRILIDPKFKKSKNHTWEWFLEEIKKNKRRR